jgi:hypothetical protein
MPNKYCNECHGRGWVWAPIYGKVAGNFVPKEGPTEPLEPKAYKTYCMSCLRRIDNINRIASREESNA